MQTLLQRSRPNLGGTITRNGATTRYAPSDAQNTDPNRAGSGGMITRSGVTRAYAPTPGVSRPAPSSSGPSQASMKFLQDGIDPQVTSPAAPGAPQRTTYDQFLQNNPGSPAATGSLATPAARPAPQQTERANPLTGDNNRQPESTTAPVQPPGSALQQSMQGTFNDLRGTTPATRAPFVQRGAGTPQGQDAAVPNEDDTIGGSMAGTQSLIAGSRRFSNPASANIYQSFLQRAFPQTP